MCCIAYTLVNTDYYYSDDTSHYLAVCSTAKWDHKFLNSNLFNVHNFLGMAHHRNNTSHARHWTQKFRSHILLVYSNVEKNGQFFVFEIGNLMRFFKLSASWNFICKFANLYRCQLHVFLDFIFDNILLAACRDVIYAKV